MRGGEVVLIHEYVALDLERAVEALNDLEPIETFYRIVLGIARRED